MSDLDKKLKEIAWSNLTFTRIDTPDTLMSPDHIAININGTWIEVNVPYESIKQAFIDDGWQKPNEFGQIHYTTVRENGVTSIVPAQPNLMTGQEWYGKYREEWNKITATGNVDSRSHIEAAKKAAGIE